MFLPATVNQDKLGVTYDFSQSRANYFYYLWVEKPVTSVILVCLLIVIVFGILRKWQSTQYFSLGFIVLYSYDMFLNVILSRVFVGVPLKLGLSSETFEGLWRVYGLGFLLTSLVVTFFAILLFVYTLEIKKSQH